MRKEISEEIRNMTDSMTLEEKVSLMLHESMAVPRLGIPEYNWWNECLHGVARAGYATVFPQAIGLAATFDPALAEEEAAAISDEARAKYNIAVKAGDRGQYRGLTFWTPNVNIYRDPRWGRGQETFGEDPYLTARMGTAVVKGLQGDDPDNMKTAACAKHFAVHSGPESNRHEFDVKPTKKDLWETYLPAFKALVDAGVESVMGAYQRLYGEPCCGSKFLLVDILRKKWGFKGHVVSDCWAVRDFHENHKVTSTPAQSAALAINNTCDLNCGCTYHAAIEAVRSGILPEKKIDESVERLLATRFKLGLMDSPEKSKWGHLGRETVGSEKHRTLARKVAQKSVVLLKNKNGLLPLKSDVKKIMVMGPVAANINSLIANYYGLNSRLVTILEGIVGKTESIGGMTIDYAQGCGMYGESRQRGWTVGLAQNADVVIACFGLDNAMEGEEGESVETKKGDREYIELPPWQLDYLKAVHDRGTPVVLVLTGGGPVAFPPDVADAILFAWYPGEEGGNAVADIIFGDAVPSGHLPVTFPMSTEDLPDFEDYSMKGRTYKFIEKEPLFPFGFGLSYTTFRFNRMEISAAEIRRGGRTAVSVDVEVENTGEYAAEETVQMYVTKNARKKDEALCALRNFAKISLEPGERKTVRFELTDSDFESVNDDGESVLVPGTYTVTAADSSPSELSLKLGAAKPLTGTVTVI